MHRKLVVRGLLGAMMLLGVSGPAVLLGQLEERAERTDALAAVVEAMFFRRSALGDTLPFDACSVYEQSGRPAGFPAGVLPGLQMLLDRPVEDPCGVPKPSEGSRFERLVRVDSVVIAESDARVYLNIRRGEWTYKEVYYLARRPAEGGGGWSLREVRMHSPVNIIPRPPVGVSSGAPPHHRGGCPAPEPQAEALVTNFLSLPQLAELRRFADPGSA